MVRSCLLLVLIFGIIPVMAQDCNTEKYEEKMAAADSCIVAGNYSLAYDNYNAAAVYCRDSAEVINGAKDELFAIINGLRNEAERNTRSNVNALRALELAKTDSVKAIRFAEMNYHLYPKSETAAGIFHDLSTSLEIKGDFSSFGGHKHDYYSVRFHSDEETILTESGDHTLRFWDLEGKQLKVLYIPEEFWSFSLDSETFLTYKDQVFTLELWDMERNKLMSFHNPEGEFRTTAFSPDGMSILTVNGDYTVRLWNIQTGESKIITQFQYELPFDASFSPDGKIVAVGLWNEGRTALFQLIDLEGRTFPAGIGCCYHTLYFSPDGQKILLDPSSFEDATLLTLKGEKWHAKTLSEYFNIDIQEIEYHHDTEEIIFNYNVDGRIALIQDYLGGDTIMTIKNSIFSEDDNWKIFNKENVSGYTIKVENIKDRFINEHNQDEIVYLVFSNINKLVLGKLKDGNTKLWDDLGNELEKMSFTSVQWNRMPPVISSDGKIVLTDGSDNVVKIWDAQGKEVQRFIGHTAEITALSISPDNQFILTGSRDGTAKLWDLKGNEIQSYIGHNSDIVNVAFSPNSKMILTSGLDNIIKLWDLKGNQLQVYTEYEENPYVVDFSSDCRSVLLGFSAEVLELDLEGNYIRSFPMPEGKFRTINLSSDRNHILTVNENNVVQLWDLYGNKLQSFTGKESAIINARFSGDGKTILSSLISRYSSEYLMGILKTPLIWEVLEQEVPKFSLIELKKMGLKFELEDIELMRQDVGRMKLWHVPDWKKKNYR